MTPIPWESKPRDFFSTFAAVTIRPMQTYPGLPDGTVGVALGFAAIVSAAVGLVLGAGATVNLPAVPVVPATFAVQFALTNLLRVGILGLLFAVSVKLLGGPWNHALALRAAAYASSVVVVRVLVLIPVVGHHLQLPVVVFELAFISFACGLVARGRHGLSKGRAIGAGAIPGLVVMAILGALMLVVVASGQSLPI